MGTSLNALLLCMYTLVTCAGMVGLVYWISPERLAVCPA